MDWQPIETQDRRELWLPVPDRPGYEVSNIGRARTKAGRILGQWPNDQGYMLVRLNHPREVVRVHRLVAGAFVPNPGGKPFINHIDCVRSNNEATNLEWCTQSENLRHSDRLGRMQKNYWLGRRSPSAGLTDDQVRDIRRLYAAGQMSWATIGRMFGVAKRSVGRVIRRETYVDVQ